MKIIIENTDKIVTLVTAGGEVPARIWQGQTESGINVQCLITRIAAPAAANLEQFDRELQETAAPSIENAFPLRMIL